jgi:transposase
LTDAGGVPLSVVVTGANRNDITQLLPLLDVLEPVKGKKGHPRQRPAAVQGDRAYDSQGHRSELRRRGIKPLLAKRRVPHGSGLGKSRWVVERTFAWLHDLRRLRVRYERRADIHEALLKLACVLVCHDCLLRSFC